MSRFSNIGNVALSCLMGPAHYAEEHNTTTGLTRLENAADQTNATIRQSSFSKAIFGIFLSFKNSFAANNQRNLLASIPRNIPAPAKTNTLSGLHALFALLQMGKSSVERINKVLPNNNTRIQTNSQKTSLKLTRKNMGFLKAPLIKLSHSIKKEWKIMSEQGGLDFSKIQKYTPSYATTLSGRRNIQTDQ